MIFHFALTNSLRSLHRQLELPKLVKVYRTLDDIIDIRNPVVTIGTFDGVHIGHRKILERIIQIAKNNNAESVVMTFDPHPRHVLQKKSDVSILSTLEEKIELLEEIGIDVLYVQHFNLEFAALSSEAFVEEILVKGLGTKKLVIGYDHHFGKNREGSLADLVRMGKLFDFDVEEIPAQDIDDVIVSSTKIRNALLCGDVAGAKEFLSYPYYFKSKVIEGRKLGRAIGFPTANLEIPNNKKLIPVKGVYAVEVKIENTKHIGMLNIGTRPTVDSSKDLKAEVHIFDFNQNIYGKNITICFIKRIRDELKFESPEKLAEQLHIDKRNVISIFQS